MSRTITQRELRDDSEAVLREVQAGHTLIASLVASIMGAGPELPSRRRPLAPERFDCVVKRCLDRAPVRP